MALQILLMNSAKLHELYMPELQKCFAPLLVISKVLYAMNKKKLCLIFDCFRPFLHIKVSEITCDVSDGKSSSSSSRGLCRRGTN